LEVLQESGGSGKTSAVIDLVIEKLNISDAELQITVKSGQPRVLNQIHWARLMLAKTDYLVSSTRGFWSLTKKGLSATLSESDMLSIWQLMKLRESPRS